MYQHLRTKYQIKYTQKIQQRHSLFLEKKKRFKRSNQLQVGQYIFQIIYPIIHLIIIIFMIEKNLY